MVFISYSRTDFEQVRPFIDCLEKNEIKYWLDNSNIPVGEAFVIKLGEALRQATIYLLVDTPNSRISYWVGREKNTAFRYHRNEGILHTMRTYTKGLEIDKSYCWDIDFPFIPEYYEKIVSFLKERMGNAPKHYIEVGDTSNFIDIPEQPRNWIGRQDVLNILDNWWLNQLSGAWITGIGGAGKSSLIATWITALTHLGYTDDVIIPILYIPGKEITNTKNIERLHSWHKESNERRGLIVIEGLNESGENSDFEKLIQIAFSTGNRILISSRTSIPSKFKEAFIIVNLDSFSNRDTIQYLIQSGISNNLAKQIHERLAGHPLAIELFTKVLLTQNLSEEEALKRLNTIGTDTIDKNFSINSSSTEQATFTVLMNSFQSATPNAQQLMIHLTNNESQILQWSDSKPPNLTTEEAENALKALAELSLIQLENSHSQKFITIHPLVRAIVQNVVTKANTSKEGSS